MEPSEFQLAIEQIMRFGIVVDPLLANALGPREWDAGLTRAVAAADSLFARYGTAEHYHSASEVPYSLVISHLCLQETFLATAIMLAHRANQQLLLHERVLEQAFDRLENFLRDVGFKPLYDAYYGIAGHDLLEPLIYCKEIPMAEFSHGAKHYPYPPENLDAFLYIALYRHVLRLRYDGGAAKVAISRVGTRTYDWLHDLLVQTGYLRHRVQLSFMYQFAAAVDGDEVARAVWPEMRLFRQSFVNWMQLEERFRVLEVACGKGQLTLDAGLARRVCSGSVTATDKSSLYLMEAKDRLTQSGDCGNVRFERALAEQLHYRDNTYDVACGSLLLPDVDGRRAVAEMARVVKPGGTVALLQTCQLDFRTQFFRDWFEPVFQLMGWNNGWTAAPNHHPMCDEVADDLQAAGLVVERVAKDTMTGVFDNPQLVVQYIVSGSNFIEEQLSKLPWDHRNTLIAELMDRGRDVCRKYPIAERRVRLPVLMIEARKPQGTRRREENDDR